MRYLRVGAAVLLVALCLLAMVPAVVVGDRYEEQFREHIDEPPNARFPLGTDALGRNRLSRLLYGTRTSLLLGPAAALLSVAVAAVVGLAAVAGGRAVSRAFQFTVDLMGSLPWLFVLIAMRAMLPLDTSPLIMNTATFALLALLGWAAPARMISSAAAAVKRDNCFLQADACGISPWRLWSRHLAPAIWPVAAAQVWVNVPVFILSEANLGLLGLGVAEPAPSLGNLMRELENLHALTYKPWLLAPVLVLVLTVWSLYILGRRQEVRC